MNKVYGIPEKKKDEGKYLRHLGEYVRIVSQNSTVYGRLIHTDYDETVLTPTLNIIGHPFKPKKIICGEETKEPTTLDTKQIVGISFLGRKAFDKYLEAILENNEK